MRWIAVGATVAAALSGGCLDLPPPPGGPAGTAHLRHQHLVRDLDGNGNDDLVTWGSDDATGASTIEIRWGAANRPLSPLPDLELAPRVNLSVPRYEVLDVDVFDANGDAHDDLVVAWGEDLSPRVGGEAPSTRTLYVGYFPGESTPTFGDVVHGQPITGEPAQRGGYADQPVPVFVAGRQRAASSPARQIILGTVPELYYLDVNDADGTLPVREPVTFDDEGVPAADAEPVDAVRADRAGDSDILIAAAGYIYRTQGDPAPATTWPTGDLDLLAVTDQRLLVFANNVDGQDYALVTDHSAVLTIVRAPEDPGALQPLDRFTLGLGGPPVAVAMSELDDPRVAIAALDEVAAGVRQLEVFFDVAVGSPDTEATFQTSTTLPLEDAPAYDDLAIGRFQDGAATIYLISTGDPLGHPPRCLEVALDDTLQDCTF